MRLMRLAACIGRRHSRCAARDFYRPECTAGRPGRWRVVEPIAVIVMFCNQDIRLSQGR